MGANVKRLFLDRATYLCHILSAIKMVDFNNNQCGISVFNRESLRDRDFILYLFDIYSSNAIATKGWAGGNKMWITKKYRVIWVGVMFVAVLSNSFAISICRLVVFDRL